jgi:hypothetical protein
VNPNNNQEKTWFDSIPNPELPTQPEPPHHHKTPSKKWFFILPVIILLIIGGSVFALKFLATPSVDACLSQSDYTALTGSPPDAQASLNDSFYTTSLKFSNNSDNFTNPEEASQTIKKISDFSTTRSSSTSTIVTISSDYTSNDSEAAAKKRIEKIRDTLVQNNVSPRSIKTNLPTPIQTDGELSADSIELAQATAYISIASENTCTAR